MVINDDFHDAFAAIGTSATVREDVRATGSTAAVRDTAGTTALRVTHTATAPVDGVGLSAGGTGGINPEPEPTTFELYYDPFRVTRIEVREVDHEERYVVVAAEDFATDPPQTLVFRCGVFGNRPYADRVVDPLL